jgi:LacI family transcriptional regulator
VTPERAAELRGGDVGKGFVGNLTEVSGYEAARRFLALRTRAPAIFVSNDSMAVRALSALRYAGVRVPEDIAVGGFDDIPMARYTSPPLTSVRVPMGDLGAHAVGCLLSAIGAEGRHVARRQTLPTELVVRASCGRTIQLDE